MSDRRDTGQRLLALEEDLARAADARMLVTTSIWSDAWNKTEQKLIEELLALGPADDAPRYRLQIAIKACRDVRGAIEHQSRTEAGLAKQIAQLVGQLEGRETSERV